MSATIDEPALTLAERFATAAHPLCRWLALSYALLAPLVVLPVSGTEFAGAADLLAPVCCAVVLLGGSLRRLRPFHVMMLALWAAALVSLLPIGDAAVMQSCFVRWLRFVALGAPLFLGMVCGDDRKLPLQVLRTFVWGGLLAIAAGLVVYWLQIPIHPDQQQLYFKGGEQPMLRAGGLAGNTGIFGHLVATWAVLALGLSRDLSSPARRQAVALMVLAVATYTIWVCSSRSALLNVIVAGVYGWCLIGDSRQRWAAAGSTLGIVLPGVLLVAVPATVWLARDSKAMQASLIRFMPGQRSGLDDYASGRLENWSLYLGEVESHPFLGAGYKTGYRKFHERAPDNSAVSILYETGLLGLITGCGLVFAILVPLTLRGSRGDPQARLLAAAWMGQIAHGMTADIYTFWLAMPVLYLLTGLVLSQPALDASNEETASL